MCCVCELLKHRLWFLYEARVHCNGAYNVTREAAVICMCLINSILLFLNGITYISTSSSDLSCIALYTAQTDGSLRMWRQRNFSCSPSTHSGPSWCDTARPPLAIILCPFETVRRWDTTTSLAWKMEHSLLQDK